MSSCVYLPCKYMDSVTTAAKCSLTASDQPCSGDCKLIFFFFFARFNGYRRYTTFKQMFCCYIFMVAVNLPIKVKELCSAFLQLVELQSILWWRRWGEGWTVFSICQLFDRQQHTVNQSPPRWGRPYPSSEQTNHQCVLCVYVCVCVCVCVFTLTVHCAPPCHVELTLHHHQVGQVETYCNKVLLK